MRRSIVILVLIVIGLGGLTFAVASATSLHESLAQTATPTAQPTATPPPTATPQPTLAPSPSPTPLPAVGAGYWHTSGTQVVDTYNRPVRIAAVTWYGMESAYWVPAGLDFQRYTKIMDLVKKLGYNTIRLPFSNELVERNPKVTQKIKANPQFRNVRALKVMDAIVKYAGKIGLKIILDDHRGHAARPKEVNNLDEPLWYSKQYPESAWINDWKFLANRYLGNDAVIGFDLRNEPHTNGPGPWNLHAYLYQGSTWGPYKGLDNPNTDWQLGAERGGNAVLAVNPHLLMFVEGIQLYPRKGQPYGIFSYWWSGILTPAKQYPVVFNVPNQLVYSPHDWGPHKWEMPWFKGMTYASISKVWHQQWSFLLDNPSAPYAAPIWLGEFGTCTDQPDCIDKQTPGSQATWFHYLIRYLKEHPQINWGFFALDGTNSNNSPANNAVLNHKWNGIANKSLQKLLGSVQPKGFDPTAK